MILGTFIKQPADTMDYDINYSEWLTFNDNVQEAAILIEGSDSTLIKVSHFINDPVIKIWLSGGTAGITYKVTCTMTSADGRIRQDEFKMKIKEY